MKQHDREANHCENPVTESLGSRPPPVHRPRPQVGCHTVTCATTIPGIRSTIQPLHPGAGWNAHSAVVAKPTGGRWLQPNQNRRKGAKPRVKVRNEELAPSPAAVAQPRLIRHRCRCEAPANTAERLTFQPLHSWTVPAPHARLTPHGCSSAG